MVGKKKNGALLSLQRTACRLNPLLLSMENALTRRVRRGIQAINRVLPRCSRGHCRGIGRARFQPMTRSLFRRLIPGVFPVLRTLIIIFAIRKKVNPQDHSVMPRKPLPTISLEEVIVMKEWGSVARTNICRRMAWERLITVMMIFRF